MKCEICKTMEKLGLDPATHEQWACADAISPSLMLKKAQVAIHHFWYSVCAAFQARWQYAGRLVYQRVRFVTLGL